MRLINKNKGTPFADVGAYVCELTDELDALANTLGGIHYNHDNIVTGIEINTDCVNKIYLLNAKELVNKYIGDKIEFEK